MISLAELLATKSDDEKEFLSIAIRRDQNADGTDNGNVRRMQNPQCVSCHAEFKRKYPGRPFAVRCEGVWDQDDYQAIQEDLRADGDDMSLDEIREVKDPAFWAERHLVYKTEEGDILPFVTRWYQTESLRCTSPRKIDRWGRGMGKTASGIIEELHYICNHKKTEVIIVCPSQAQAQMWWDEIMFQIDNAPSLGGKDFLVQKKQQPFLYMRFGSGAVIKIFTAGSASGKGAIALKGQSPRRIRLDEQDYLADKDYDSIMPLLRRFKNSTFHGSSTPSGLRGMYWQMCNKMSEYKEFYHPITDDPRWGTDQLNEETCFAEAKTMERYRHEWMAEFGDPAAGVFKAAFIDAAMKPYSISQCVFDPNKRYVLGIDWNAKGTGTRLCVVEYDPETRKRRIVAHSVVDDPKATTQMSFRKIIDLLHDWHCDHVYIDYGMGFAQDELLKEIGVKAGTSDPDVARLKHLNVIDFGANLITNKLVPNRDPNSKYKAEPKEDELKRRTKPFMVEGAVMAFEMELVEISREYTLLEEQLRGYRVKTWTKGGASDTYMTDAETGDHDLDALMLALLGVELHWGLWHTTSAIRRLAQIAHVSGWGMPATSQVSSPVFLREAPVAAPVSPEQLRENRREQAGVPSRNPETKGSLTDQYRILALQRNAYANTQAPGSVNKVPSRTIVFSQQNNRPGSLSRFGSQPGQLGRTRY